MSSGLGARQRGGAEPDQQGMARADAEEYTQALGQVVAGGWRQVALGKRLGVPAALGLSVEEWVEGRLGGYVRLAIDERREAVAELSGEGLSTREAAAVLGVDHATVARDVVANATPEPAEYAADAASAPAPVANATPPERDLEAEYVAEMAEQDLKVRRTKDLHLASKATAAIAAVGPRRDTVIEAMAYDRDGDWDERLEAAEKEIRRLREGIRPAGLRRVK